MKRLIFLMTLAVAVPLAASAQQGPMGPGPMGGGPNSAMMQQMQQLRATARTKMLDALTPANKQLLASLAGALAIAPSPDPSAAAAKLDAALSPTEKQAILAAASQMHAQMKAQISSMRGGAGMMGSPRPMFSSPPTDPGLILLMMSGMHGGRMMMMYHHPMR